MDRARPLESLAPFREALKDPSRTAVRWKAGGARVVGYRCLFVPEEVIWAAGMLPYPLYGTPEPITVADSYFQSCTCELVRNLFDLALKHRLDFLDALALSNTCDVSRRLYDNWNAYVKQVPVYLINNPQNLRNESNRDFFLSELVAFRQRMEELSGRRVTDDGLHEAIALYNTTRSLLADLYETRKGDTPGITGDEALDVCMASILMPKTEVNPLLRALLDEVRQRQMPDAFGPRILVTGSMIDHPALIRMIEEEGGQVVTEDLCTTSRYFRDLVEPDGDPMEALYRALDKRVFCACTHPLEARLDRLVELVDAYHVDAVINFNLKYCNPFLYDAPILQSVLDARSVPLHVLEIGHDMSGHGQLRTRIQAFIEMVE